ncbi:MAG: penicillin-binding protein, partial [Salinibacterium sp.]|nr:penicillin-binding protein [Salinibacterium sp.]
MSAQKSLRRGAFAAAVGIVGFSALAGLLVTVMVAPALAVTGVTASSTIGIFDSLPEYLTINQQPERNEIYATFAGSGNDGGYYKIATIYDQNRQEVPYDKISQFALDAAVAGEDRRFFEHGGVDLASVVRAAVGNVVSSGIESGASTLTMQLVKQIYVQEALGEPTEEARKAAYQEATAQSFDRKLREMKLAIGLEKRYTKKEILTAYLNIAFFGSNTYGIEAAAQRYYSVDAKDLTLHQAASLIAVVQYPSQNSLDDPENFAGNEERRDVILFSMLDVGDITRAQYNEAYDIPVDETTLLPSSSTSGCTSAYSHAKWFCDYVIKSVKDFEFLGANPAERAANWKRGGYKLYTTLDLDAQIPAQDATWTYAPNTETAFALGSATASVQGGTGRVLVMTENKEFNDTLEGGGPTTSAVNYNTSFDYGGSTGFQPGSTYKVFTLIEWLNQNKGISERVLGDGRTIPGAKFADSCNGPWGGPVTFKNNSGERGIYDIRVGSVQSINGVFFSMAVQLDLCKIKNVAESLGVERADYGPLQTNPASIIGTNEVTPLSMAAAYAAIGAGGVYCKPIIVDRAIAPDGTDLPGQAKQCRQAISPEVAATTAFVLEGVPRTGNA